MHVQSSRLATTGSSDFIACENPRRAVGRRRNAHTSAVMGRNEG
jgi:hypothetical protein